MDELVDVGHDSLLSVVALLHLTTPEKQVVHEVLDVPGHDDGEGQEKPLVDVFAIRQINKRLGHTPQRRNAKNQDERKTEGRLKETLHHNRSFAIGKRVINLWHTYHRENSTQLLGHVELKGVEEFSDQRSMKLSTIEIASSAAPNRTSIALGSSLSLGSMLE